MWWEPQTGLQASLIHIQEAPCSTVHCQRRGEEVSKGCPEPGVALDGGPLDSIGALIPPSQEQAELTVRACELRAKEEKLAAEREALERERQELRLEKDRLHKASLRLQARAQELEHMSKVCLGRAVG